MKKKQFVYFPLLIFFFLFTLCITNNSFARGLFAKKGSPVGTTFNFDVGFGYSPTKLVRGTTEEKWSIGVSQIGFGRDLGNANNYVLFQIRADVSYMEWKANNGESTSRFYPFVGLRILIPITSYLIVVGDVGGEVHLVGSSNSSVSEIGIGAGFGGGLEYHFSIGSGDPILTEIGEQDSRHLLRFVIGASFRYHTQGQSFITLTPYIGLRF